MQRSRSIANILLWIFFILPLSWLLIPSFKVSHHCLWAWRCGICLINQTKPTHTNITPPERKPTSWQSLLPSPRGHGSLCFPRCSASQVFPGGFSILPVARATFCMNTKPGTLCSHVAVSIQADWNEVINMVAWQIFITSWQVFLLSDVRVNASVPVKGTGVWKEKQHGWIQHPQVLQ